MYLLSFIRVCVRTVHAKCLWDQCQEKVFVHMDKCTNNTFKKSYNSIFFFVILLLLLYTLLYWNDTIILSYVCVCTCIKEPNINFRRYIVFVWRYTHTHTKIYIFGIKIIKFYVWKSKRSLNFTRTYVCTSIYVRGVI